MTSIFRYSLKLGDEEKKSCGAAQVHDVDASYKDLSEVLRAIKGRDVKKARVILEEAIALRKAIPLRKFSKGAGHRSELGGRKGKYPKKECRLALQLLENAVANAVHKGLDEERLFVKHACAFKGNVFRRYRRFWVSGNTLGYGKRAIWANYVTARAELVVKEGREPAQDKGKREAKKQGDEPKQGERKTS